MKARLVKFKFGEKVVRVEVPCTDNTTEKEVIDKAKKCLPLIVDIEVSELYEVNQSVLK